jgi:trans-2-enoyl-CoA reductase
MLIVLGAWCVGISMSFSRTLRLRDDSRGLILQRLYATHTGGVPHRAVVFSDPGDPRQVASVKTSGQLPLPGEGEVQLRMRLAPINPSDLNVIQGVYPMKLRARENLGTSHPVFIPGNEGLGEVIAIGPSANGLNVGDRVVMGVSQAGTWSNHMNIKANGLILVRPSVSDVQAATMSVCRDYILYFIYPTLIYSFKINPPTALAMLRQFVPLSKGDFIIQNGANSAVGETATSPLHNIQIPKFLLRTGSNPDRSGAWIKDNQFSAQQV